MKARWLSQSGHGAVVVVFGGWALGPAPFLGLTGRQDILFVDDYRDLDNSLPYLGDYDSLTLLAFSFGVASAAHWLSMTGFRPARSVAVSGTLCPSDPERGIRPDLIRATAEGLTKQSFAKFCLRAGLDRPVSSLDIAAAQAELFAVIERGPAPETVFDRIWIPQKDRIIPSAAQMAAWRDQEGAVRHVPGPHVPFRAGQSWAAWLA